MKYLLILLALSACVSTPSFVPGVYQEYEYFDDCMQYQLQECLN